MTDQLISFETAKLAKEKGFDEPVLSYWWDSNPNLLYGDQSALAVSWRERNSDSCGYYVSAPSQSLLQKWLREEHKIMISPFIAWNLITYGYNIHFIGSKNVYEEASKRIYHGADQRSYEEALELGLQEALKLIKI
jgi:hypothetical protein